MLWSVIFLLLFPWTLIHLLNIYVVGFTGRFYFVLVLYPPSMSFWLWNMGDNDCGLRAALHTGSLHITNQDNQQPKVPWLQWEIWCGSSNWRCQLETWSILSHHDHWNLALNALQRCWHSSWYWMGMSLSILDHEFAIMWLLPVMQRWESRTNWTVFSEGLDLQFFGFGVSQDCNGEDWPDYMYIQYVRAGHIWWSALCERYWAWCCVGGGHHHVTSSCQPGPLICHCMFLGPWLPF